MCFNHRSQKLGNKSRQEMHFNAFKLYGERSCFEACFGANRSIRVTWSRGERSEVRGHTEAEGNWKVELFRGSLRGFV